MIKVIEGMKPSEVLKAVEDGETKVAWFNTQTDEWTLVNCRITVNRVAEVIGIGHKVAIIDDSQQVIDWDGFWWEFFEPYGGLPLCYSDIESTLPINGSLKSAEVANECEYCHVRQSPPYPWFGGKQPVPDNVEVEAVFRNETDLPPIDGANITPANQIQWDHDGGSGDIIAFRLTGRVL